MSSRRDLHFARVTNVRSPHPPTATHGVTTLYLTTKLALTLLLAPLGMTAQTTTTQQAPAPQQQTPAPTAPPADTPHGEVLFQSHGDAPVSPEDTTAPALQRSEPTGPVLTDAERSAILFTAYDLDARLNPDASHLAMRARLTLRNTGSQPLTRIALQISSSLTWESASLLAATTMQLPLTQHFVETDTDHTGKASEAILTLPEPLAPGALITLDTFYTGEIAADATRLERIGADATQALSTDWDAIGNDETSSSSSATPAPASPVITALRGFGNVLWYPVASPQLFLGDGAKLFQAVGHQRLAERSASIHLHLAVEYKGEPPVAAFFCGRRQPLVAHADDPNAALAARSGLATGDFAATPLGFRQPSLFVVQLPESLIAPLPEVSSSAAAPPFSTDDDAAKSAATPVTSMLAVETADPGTLTHLASSAESIAPLLQQWFGLNPLTPLTILDHTGEPFEDGPLLVAPIDALSSTSSSGALAHSLTHAWVQTGQPWFDEGLAQFVGILWTEQEKGRDAALLQLNNLIQPLNVAEVGFDTEQAADAASAPAGQPLVSATDELYYRRKAAAVWWMLRGITGDQPLQEALAQWCNQPRTQPFSHDDATIQAIGFEKLLEKTSGKDLGWFFSDWVLRDRGLPDLSIVDVEPRQLPAGKGHDSGWLVAVTVHNDGAPAVDVPLTVLSGTFTTTKRIRIPGFSNVTDRIVVEAPPSQVILNDGSTPEVRASTHSREVVIQPAQPFQ